MPIQIDVNIRHLDQAEFGEIAYDVMDHILLSLIHISEPTRQ